MGLETARRWPIFILLSFTILLMISLLSSWTNETDLGIQLQECSKQQATCMEESLSILEQRDSYLTKINDADKEKSKLKEDLATCKNKLVDKESQYNRTQLDHDICKTELQSLKNLQVSKSATLETLRLEKETLTSKLEERKKRIEQLEGEIERLKDELNKKEVLNNAIVTPSQPKPIPAAGVSKPIENNAKEIIEDQIADIVESDNGLN